MNVRTRGTVLAAAALAGLVALAGCGQQTLAMQRALAAAQARAAAAATTSAISGNTGCVRAMPVAAHALGVLGKLNRRALTTAQALSMLAADQATIGALVRTTSDPALQENLAEISDAFAAFGAVLASHDAAAHAQTLANLTGLLTGLRLVCPVANPDFTSGTQGWAAANGSTALSRSATGPNGRWSMQVTNTAASPGMAAFTDSPPWVPVTLKGPEQIGLWARAVTGAPTLTLRVTELSGGAVVGSTQVSVKLGPAFRFAGLTYQIRRPGSRLSLAVSAGSLAPHGAVLVDDITIVRD